MRIEEILIQAKIRKARKEKRKEAIEELLLNSRYPEKVIDCLNSYEILDFSNEVLKLKVRGYRNVFDYILKKYRFMGHYNLKEGIDIELSQVLIENIKDVSEQYINDEVLLSKMPDGRMVLDVMIEKNNGFIPQIKTIELAKELIRRKRIDLLVNATIKVLRCEIAPGETVFEEMIKQQAIPNINYMNIKGHPLITPKCDILFEKIKGEKEVIDYLLETNLEIEFLPIEMVQEDWPKLIEVCLKHQRYEAIKDGPENFFLQKVKTENGDEIILFNYLVSKNVKPNIVGSIENEEIIKTSLFKLKNTLTLVENCPYETLVGTFSETKISLLETIMLYENRKKEGRTADELAKDEINYDKIVRTLYGQSKLNDKVALLLARRGIFFKPLNETKEIGIDKNRLMQKYIYDEVKVPTQVDNEELVESFRIEFADNQSDQEIIEDIIASFNMTVLTDKEEAIRDLEALILYKKQHPQFKLINNPDTGSYFKEAVENYGGEINLSRKHNLYALTHEWGHLIHEFYNNSKTPKAIKALLPYDFKYGSTNYPEAYQLFKQLDKEAQELLNDENIRHDFIAFINKQKGSIKAYKEEIKKEYTTLIGTNKLLLEALKNVEMADEAKQALANAYYEGNKEKFLTKEYVNNYVSERLNAELAEFKEISYQKYNAEFLCYENFIDAYYGGVLGDITAHESTQAPTCTHNSSYFEASKKIQFMELFANYVELKKAPRGAQYIERLKEKTSPELIWAIEDYYKNLGFKKDKTLI